VITVDLIYFNAGGGHRAAAAALQASIREQEFPWRVRLVDLTQVLDPHNAFRKATGFAPEDFYNGRLARGWTVGLAQELKLLQGMIRLGHQALTRKLRRHWLATQPDMVVSLIPNFNRPLYASLHAALPGRPYVTVLTDLADYPPNFWIERGQVQHLICGTPRALAQARAAGYPEQHIHATSGMIISPEFYRPAEIDRVAEQRKLGLLPGRMTGLVMFGAHGSNVMQSIARQLEDTPLILICGHNHALAERLRAMKFAAPRVIVGFTPQIQYYMRLTDFLIGKPGPGSISEAVQQRLPVIVVGNSWTMPQERYNIQWIRENRAGLVLPSYRNLHRAVTEMAIRLDEFRSSIASMRNRAVFEIPGILAGILEAQPLVANLPISYWDSAATRH
jgi:UDP-N-acetylglucosamine:LPS N-acetylglucosamine transferase